MIKNKTDEWYTLKEGVDFMIDLCKDKIKGRRVYLPCDNFQHSEFFKTLKERFEELELTSLEAFDIDGNYARYDGRDLFTEKLDEGGFSSEFSLQLFEKCDFYITNPPFSIFDEFIKVVDSYKKDFILISSFMSCTSIFVSEKIIQRDFYAFSKHMNFLRLDGSVKSNNCAIIANFPITKKRSKN